MNKNIKDLTGRQFGFLTVISFSHTVKGKNRKTYWVCKCVCGSEKLTTSDLLTQKKIISCGCKKKERIITQSYKHGHASRKNASSTWNSWRGMVERCTNPNHISYKNYGGRGIVVCEAWKNSFENFLNDMGEKPSGLSIERINLEGSYEPGNCKWATSYEQSRNQSRNILITYKGVTKCLQDWANEFNINRKTIQHRLNSGWGIEESLETPPRLLKKKNCNL